MAEVQNSMAHLWQNMLL